MPGSQEPLAAEAMLGDGDDVSAELVQQRLDGAPASAVDGSETIVLRLWPPAADPHLGHREAAEDGPAEAELTLPR